MPEALHQALGQHGLLLLVLTVFVAGVVRGFSGFGTAMVFIPVASKFIEPVWVLVALTVMDVLGPIPNLPKAWRDGEPKDVARLGMATIVALPFGLALLFGVPVEVFRYLVAALAIIVPISLLAGLRYKGQLTPFVLYAGGAVAGITGGAAGLPGPPVIMLYAASMKPVRSIRANTMMYLFLFDIALLSWLFFQDKLEAVPIWLGLLFFAPAILGNIVGATLFDPSREKQYRGIAYCIILLAALTSLPLWD
jgi:uncharacterized protein